MQFYDVLEDDMHAKVSDWLKRQSYISASGIDREQLWFHRDGTYFNPLWEKRYDRWNSHPFEDIIDQVIARLAALNILGNLSPNDINSCLVNYYRDGNAFIPKHVDSINVFGPSPTIINLSIGETRVLRAGGKDYSLVDNSVFIMSGPSVPHELLKDPTCTGPRWSMTFRKHSMVPS
jgi:hypothetical protein